MVRLREYTGIDTDAIADLKDRGLLTKHTDRPHRLYSLTQAGRDALDITRKLGRDYGDYVGDLNETSLHRLAIEDSQTYLDSTFVDDPDHPAETTVCYAPVDRDGDDDTRLDVACLDSSGDICVTLEVETINNDRKTAIPADYDKMAACDPTDAIWVVTGRAGGHAVLEALNNPADGTTRVAKTYGETTPPHGFKIDEPGFTQALTITRLRNQLDCY
jgi:hypothetical protein